MERSAIETVGGAPGKHSSGITKKQFYFTPPLSINLLQGDAFFFCPPIAVLADFMPFLFSS